jgi:hypothetical protein
MKAIRKRPEQLPELIDVENDGDAIQAELDGPIEAFTLTEDLAILCDEEGRLKNKAPNIALKGLGVDFVGTILIVGVDGEDFCDVPKLDAVLWAFFRMVRYGRADRAHNVFNCRHCGNLHQFEADGPYENGWNLCPVCGGTILRPVINGEAHS